MQHLWIHFGTDDDAGYLSGNNSLIEWYWNASDYAYTGTRATNQTVYGYSTAGVALPYRFLMLSSGYRQRPQGFTGMDSQGWTCFQCIYADGTYSQVPVNMEAHCELLADLASRLRPAEWKRMENRPIVQNPDDVELPPSTPTVLIEGDQVLALDEVLRCLQSLR